MHTGMRCLRSKVAQQTMIVLIALCGQKSPAPLWLVTGPDMGSNGSFSDSLQILGLCNIRPGQPSIRSRRHEQ